jgi:ABC-2 type transport system permease protein
MNGAFVTLIRREFWENKSLWMVPLAAAALILGGTLFGDISFDGGVQIRPQRWLGGIAGTALVGIMAFLGTVGGITIFTYLTDCLFSERKDRSILFWKSLPVSDARTVLSKLAVALLILPLGLMLLAVITHFLVTAIMLVRFDDAPLISGSGYWSGWASALGRSALIWIFALLWYLPVAVYLMLASVSAKRAPLMYVVLPPVVLMLWEKLMLESSHITEFLFRRLVPPNLEHLVNPRGDAWMAFQDLQLWIGLAVAAGMLYIVIRLRRYRDDT